MKLTAVVVAAAAVGLAGCASMSTGDGNSIASTKCDGSGACKVDVSVTACIITQYPTSLLVTTHNVNIFWELDKNSQSYQFRDVDGVTLKQPDSDFGEPQSQAHGKKYKLHDKNSKARPGEQLTYPYRINVQYQFGGQWLDCPEQDPTIINQG